ncbi:MAG TPA: hypothetical protein VM238_13945 [Phycisphaerae bacterium]|nr:hypothetical protein [Phycisphaerae bacterium]
MRTGSTTTRSDVRLARWFSATTAIATRLSRRVPRPAARLPHAPQRRAGVALLEVVLGLALFFGVAVAILAGLSACVRSARDLRLQARAADLAITLLSEMQLGAVEIEDAGPMGYEDEALEDWSWEVTVTPIVGNLTELELTRVEIVIRNTPHDYTHRLYHLLSESPVETEMAFGDQM